MRTAHRRRTGRLPGLGFFRQHCFVCNSPDTVKRVFLEEHDNYDRKRPQMRHALEPLLGDGLFVSDGALWTERRAQCAPAFENALLPQFAAVPDNPIRHRLAVAARVRWGRHAESELVAASPRATRHLTRAISRGRWPISWMPVSMAGSGHSPSIGNG
jgi:cytochrome P450